VWWLCVVVVFLGEPKGGGEELALKKMDTGKLDAEDVELVTASLIHILSTVENCTGTAGIKKGEPRKLTCRMIR
jgi:hypothetical protein